MLAFNNASTPASAGASPAPPASSAEIQSFLNHQAGNAAGHVQPRGAAATPAQINVSGELARNNKNMGQKKKNLCFVVLVPNLTIPFFL